MQRASGPCASISRHDQVGVTKEYQAVKAAAEHVLSELRELAEDEQAASVERALGVSEKQQPRKAKRAKVARDTSEAAVTHAFEEAWDRLTSLEATHSKCVCGEEGHQRTTAKACILSLATEEQRLKLHTARKAQLNQRSDMAKTIAKEEARRSDLERQVAQLTAQLECVQRMYASRPRRKSVARDPANESQEKLQPLKDELEGLRQRDKQLHCCCRVYYDERKVTHKKMLECNTCNGWFHHNCIGIGNPRECTEF